MENRLREALASGRFAVTVEAVMPGRDRALREALAPALALAEALAGDLRVDGLAVTDRVRTDEDHDPVPPARLLGRASGMMPLVHFAGKGRDPEDLARSLGALAAAGLENVLCVTGDRLKSPQSDRPVRFVDSVDAVALARRLLPRALVAAAVSPFKYTEEETFNQYFKMAKKHAVGADCLITQVGWDMARLAELVRYRRARGFVQPVLAGLMLLPPGAARRLHKGAVPGVVVTDDLLALVEFEAQAPDRGKAARLERLALQMVGAERLGYAGVQLSGLATVEDVGRVLDLYAAWREQLPAIDQFWPVWQERLRLPSGETARVGLEPGYGILDGAGSAAAADARQHRLFRALATVHCLGFERGSPVFRVLGPLARRIPPDSHAARWLARIEGWIKTPLVGCQLCGYCRLPDTFYICPETCPKGLANGPCGGSTENRCEAGDRECVHSARYRLAKALGRLDDLEHLLIPPVSGPRGGSSWLNHYAGRSPEAMRTIGSGPAGRVTS